MSLLAKVHRGKEYLPPRIVLFGWEGVGKSSCGNTAPNPIFIDTEGGLSQIDCSRFPQALNLDDVSNAIKELQTEDHDFQTIVIDSADALERLIHQAICKRYNVNSIEKAAGSFGKGYVEAVNEFDKILKSLDELRRSKGMIIIIIAHAKVEKFFDPEELEYDRYSPRLHKNTCALLKEWSDAVLFATRKMIVRKTEDGRSAAVAIGQGGGNRILKTEAGPACVAKNRYGMPPEIPMHWDAIVAAITKSSETTQ